MHFKIDPSPYPVQARRLIVYIFNVCWQSCIAGFEEYGAKHFNDKLRWNLGLGLGLRRDSCLGLIMCLWLALNSGSEYIFEIILYEEGEGGII